MSRRADPKLIGGFVVAGGALLVAGIVALGGGWLGERHRSYVAYFDESVKGLRIGAPVTLRGVKVGEVKEVKLVYASDSHDFLVPVILDIDPATLAIAGDPVKGRNEMTTLLGHGLRAQLQLESLVTGQLYVALELRPDTPGTLTRNAEQLPQVPTIGSPWQKLSQSLQDVALVVPSLVTRVDALLGRSEAILAGIDPVKFGEGVNAMADTAKSLKTATDSLPAMVARVEAVLAKVDAAAAAGDSLMQGLDEQLAASILELERALGAVRRAGDQLGAVFADNRRGLKDFVDRGLPNFGGLIDDASRMVNELSGAIRDMRQDPSRFLFGSNTREGVRPR